MRVTGIYLLLLSSVHILLNESAKQELVRHVENITIEEGMVLRVTYTGNYHLERITIHFYGEAEPTRVWYTCEDVCSFDGDFDRIKPNSLERHKKTTAAIQQGSNYILQTYFHFGCDKLQVMNHKGQNKTFDVSEEKRMKIKRIQIAARYYEDKKGKIKYTFTIDKLCGTGSCNN